MNTKQALGCLAAMLFAGMTQLLHAGGNPPQPLSLLCYPATAKVDLDINNVRATIMNGGDMWWDLSDPQYEVPKGGGAHSMFSGALWIGGLDAGGQLHVAAITYRQTGVDFWPGPLDTINASATDSACRKYDRIWKLDRAEVQAFIDNRMNPSYVIPESILSWPGNGDASQGHAHYLAPFKDADGDGLYNPLNGDYPGFALDEAQNCERDLLGDQCLWWVFNDKGGGMNTHTETGGAAFGLEIHAQAFAYRTNDEVNDMTFYQHRLINRSTNTYSQMYFGNWFDSDIGLYSDDYVGCDVSRGMGYAYNGDADDGISPQLQPGTYGAHPPALGYDILGGPLAAQDFIDNDRDNILDEPGERIPMSSFVFHGKMWPTGNPENAQQFYNYLCGLWQDGSPMTYGGNAYGGTLPTKFMFPNNSDPANWGTNGVTPPFPGWGEENLGNGANIPSDRRFLISSGPFILEPGAVQTVTGGLLWARDTNGNNLDAVVKLQQASDKAQLLFDNCFQITCSTAAAPHVSAVMQSAGHFSFSASGEGSAWSWDFGDGGTSQARSPMYAYAASGTYVVCVTVTNACGTVGACDTIEVEVPVNECGPSLWRIEGTGNGMQLLDFSQRSIDSVFASPQHRVLHPYYEPVKGPVKIVVEDFLNLVEGDYVIRFDDTSRTARWKLYLVGGPDTVYSDSTISFDGRQHIPQWGIAVEMQQVFSPGKNANPVRNGFIEATMTFSDPSKAWLGGVQDEEYGSIENWIRSGSVHSGTGGCEQYAGDEQTAGDVNEDYEKILGGTWAPYRLVSESDAGGCFIGPAIGYNSGINSTFQTINKFSDIANVDLVITSDTSKWSRCLVLETGDVNTWNEGQQRNMRPRARASVNKLGQPDGSGTTGMGWFPGYAINLETGERLNVMFGEDSGQPGHNGRDMLWNPTSDRLNPIDGMRWWGGKHYVYIMGHNGDMLYGNTPADLAGELKDVPRYDGCETIRKILQSSNAYSGSLEFKEVFADAMWVGIPLLAPGRQVLESDVKIRLRVAKPYRKFNTSATPLNSDNPMYGFTIDKEHFDCNIYEGNATFYPNPFTDEATLWFENPDAHAHELQIFDLRGRLVREYKNIVSDRVYIRREDMNSGVYIYVLMMHGKRMHVGKFVVKRD